MPGRRHGEYHGRSFGWSGPRSQPDRRQVYLLAPRDYRLGDDINCCPTVLPTCQPRPKSLSLLTHGGKIQEEMTTWNAPVGQDRLMEAFFGYLVSKDDKTLSSVGFDTVGTWEEISHYHRWCLYYLKETTRAILSPVTTIPMNTSRLRMWYRQKAFLLAFAPLSVVLWLIRHLSGHTNDYYEPRRPWTEVSDQALEMSRTMDSDILYHVCTARYWTHAEGGHTDRQRRQFQYYRCLVQVLLEQAPRTVREADFAWPLYRSGERCYYNSKCGDD